MTDARDTLEDLAFPGDHIDLAHRQRPVRGTHLPSLDPGDDEPVLLADWQRTQKHALNEREHHRGARNAHGRREHSRAGESPRPTQSPPGKPQVPPPVLEDHQPSLPWAHIS
jgi:hypothetical protein